MSNEEFFVCPECNKNKGIKSVHTESGKIIFKCNHECDVDDYFKNLEDLGTISANDNFKKKIKKDDSNGLILEKTENISDIIRTNQLIINTQKQHPNNYYHIQSVINLGKYYEKENNLPSDIYKTIDSINKDNKEEKKAIEDLEKEFCVYINNQTEKLILKGEEKEKKYKWLRNEGFEYLSKIKFRNLIEINLARNGIKNIHYLDDMLLPNLEILNLSENEIKDIKPVAELLSEHIRLIFLQENQIGNDNLKYLDTIQKKFRELEALRIEDNKIDYESDKFKEIKNKYGKKLVYKVDLASFNKKYGLQFKKDDKKMDLGSKKVKEILIDLYKVVNSQFLIEYLALDDNQLQNVSLLNRMPLYYLQILDLSLNLITSIKFLTKMSKICEELQKIYLNDNKISDISPLINYSKGQKFIFQKLKAVTLKNNPFYEKEKNENNTNTNDTNTNNANNDNNTNNNNANNTEEGIIMISIKDEKTKKAFEFILKNSTTDFPKNLIIKENEKIIETDVDQKQIEDQITG